MNRAYCGIRGTVDSALNTNYSYSILPQLVVAIGSEKWKMLSQMESLSMFKTESTRIVSRLDESADGSTSWNMNEKECRRTIELHVSFASAAEREI